MSFSPDIDDLLYAHANIFAHHNYTPTAEGTPHPGYYSTEFPGASVPGILSRAVSSEGITVGSVGDYETFNWTMEPLRFPTLQFFPLSYTGVITSPSNNDYLGLYTSTFVNRLPKVSIESSGFLDWSTGFGSGVFQLLSYYQMLAPGETRYKGRRELTSTPGDVTNAFTANHNTEDVIDYIQNGLINTPHISILSSRRFYGAEATAVFGSTADPIDTYDTYQQVFSSTNFSHIKPNAYYVFSNNATRTFATPTSTPTWRDLNMHAYPIVSSFLIRTDGYLGDLMLYRSKFDHGYDGNFKHVKDDIKNRFYTIGERVDRLRDEFVAARVTYYNNRLAATFKVPRDYRTKKQKSPKFNRNNYTTFDYDDTISISTSSEATTTTTMASSPTMGSSGGTSGGGGSY